MKYALAALSLTALLLLPAMPAMAQDPNSPGSPTPSPSPSRVPMWRCDLPGGTYEVAVRNIISVSVHDYVVDAVARVTEMNIETAGSTEVRFYYLEPVTPSAPGGVGQSLIDKAQEAASQVTSRLNNGDQPPWEKVVKNYPATTHAHTVEFRLDTKDDLQTLFKSAEQAFRLNQNTSITLEGGPATSDSSSDPTAQ